MSNKEPITPPSFVDGLTPEEILSTDGTRLIGLYGKETAVEILLQRRQRRQLIALLQGELTPNDEQTAFLAAVEDGVPVILNNDGLTLRKAEDGGWLCEEDGVPVTVAQPQPAEALQTYAEI